MSVLVYVENVGGKFKKSAFEVTSYSKALADKLNTSLVAISIGEVDAESLKSLGKYGASKVLHVADGKLKSFINQAYASVIAQAVQREKANTLVKFDVA